MGLWVTTSFFNPAGFRRRVRNYRIFREHLRAPLITVELSYTGEFELKPGDAEILVQLRGTDVMWQKERLLNVALSHLPAECDQAAWVDCDILFGRADWLEATEEVLRGVPMCQLFKATYQLLPDPPAFTADHSTVRQRSFGYGYALGMRRELITPPGIVSEFRLGHGWAARRELLESCGIYDRGVIGGGDKFMAMAAIGTWEQLSGYGQFSAAHLEEYRGWAQTFHRAVDGRMGYVDTDVFHLWHGDMQNRKYQERYAILVQHGFDPHSDIALDKEGCWRWNTPKPEMHHAVEEYFRQRKEDGE